MTIISLTLNQKPLTNNTSNDIAKTPTKKFNKTDPLITHNGIISYKLHTNPNSITALHILQSQHASGLKREY
jgi:hypothetical protein